MFSFSKQMASDFQFTDNAPSFQSPDSQYSHENDDFFMGYRRPDGSVGIRNEIWIIPTVSCVNPVVRAIEKKSQRLITGSIEGIRAFPHAYGCSQTGTDQEMTRTILTDIIKHPNAGGILVVGLGCEGNQIDLLKEYLGSYPSERIQFLKSQDCDNEIEEGVRLIEQLSAYVSAFEREPISCSELIIGLKGGASDGNSVFQADPAIKALSRKLIRKGATAIITEVPEISRISFTSNNANLTARRSVNEEHDADLIRDVLSYGEKVRVKGLNILSTPKNDPVAATALAAAGAHMVLFTTGRGTPFSAPVPTVKLATSAELGNHKQHWIDYTLTPEIDGMDTETLAAKLYTYILAVASGKLVSTEEAGFHDIAIWKQGATL